MVKKKVTGQTIAIIILSILLILAIGFGGVYAFYSYRTSKVSGKIVMGNLVIEFKTDDSGSSGKSDIKISNNVNVVPNEALGNTPLSISNASNAPIYVAVVYKLSAYKLEDENSLVEEDNSKPLIAGEDETLWYDQLFTSNLGSSPISYRCMVTMSPILPEQTELEVIGENKLKLSKYVGNSYQATNIVFYFQAFAISANSFKDVFDSDSTKDQKFNAIMNGIYESTNYNINL